MNIFTVRVDRANNRKTLMDRLQSGKTICMGWGGGSAGGLNVLSGTYTQNFRSTYEGVSARIMNNIGNTIRRLQEGDVFLIPNLPEDGSVIVGIVDANPYEYVDHDDTHLNHRIKLKEIFGLLGTINMHCIDLTPWYGKLRNMRLPFYPNYYIFDCIEDLITKLKKEPEGQFTANSLNDFLDVMYDDLLETLVAKIKEISPHTSEINFESVCERVLISNGYTITGRHQYDGNGGDADIVCSRDKKDASPFETGEASLYVQIKKHEGETDEEAIKQLLPFLKDAGAIGCVMSLAKSFSQEAERLATEHDIALIDGKTICAMLLGVINKEML